MNESLVNLVLHGDASGFVSAMTEAVEALEKLKSVKPAGAIKEAVPAMRSYVATVENVIKSMKDFGLIGEKVDDQIEVLNVHIKAIKSDLRSLAHENAKAATQSARFADISKRVETLGVMFQKLAGHVIGYKSQVDKIDGSGAAKARIKSLKSEIADLNRKIYKTSSATARFNKDMIRLAGRTTGIIRIFSRWRNRLLVLTFAFAGLYRSMKRFIEMASESEKRVEALNTIGTYFGISTNKLTDDLNRLTSDGLVGLEDMAQSMKNLISAGADYDTTVMFLEKMKDAALANGRAGFTMGENYVVATQGIKEFKSQTSDSIGIMTNLNTILKQNPELVKKVGATNAILIKFMEEAAVFEGLRAELYDKLNLKMQTYTENVNRMKRSIGRALEPLASQVVDYLSDQAQQITKFFDENKQYINLFAEELSEFVKVVLRLVYQIKSGLVQLMPTLLEIGDIFKNTATALMNLAKRFDKFLVGITGSFLIFKTFTYLLKKAVAAPIMALVVTLTTAIVRIKETGTVAGALTANFTRLVQSEERLLEVEKKIKTVTSATLGWLNVAVAVIGLLATAYINYRRKLRQARLEQEKFRKEQERLAGLLPTNKEKLKNIIGVIKAYRQSWTFGDTLKEEVAIIKRARRHIEDLTQERKKYNTISSRGWAKFTVADIDKSIQKEKDVQNSVEDATKSFMEMNKELKKYGVRVNETSHKLHILGTNVSYAIDDLEKFVDLNEEMESMKPIIDQSSEFISNMKTLSKETAEARKEIKLLGKVGLEKDLLEWSVSLKDNIENIVKLTRENRKVEKSLIDIKKQTEDLARSFEINYLHTPEEFLKMLKEENIGLLKERGVKSFESLDPIKEQAELIVKRLNLINARLGKVKEAFKELGESAPVYLEKGILEFNEFVMKVIDTTNDYGESIEDTIKGIKGQIEDTRREIEATSGIDLIDKLVSVDKKMDTMLHDSMVKHDRKMSDLRKQYETLQKVFDETTEAMRGKVPVSEFLDFTSKMTTALSELEDQMNKSAKSFEKVKDGIEGLREVSKDKVIVDYIKSLKDAIKDINQMVENQRNKYDQPLFDIIFNVDVSSLQKTKADIDKAINIMNESIDALRKVEQTDEIKQNIKDIEDTLKEYESASLAIEKLIQEQRIKAFANFIGNYLEMGANFVLARIQQEEAIRNEAIKTTATLKEQYKLGLIDKATYDQQIAATEAKKTAQMKILHKQQVADTWRFIGDTLKAIAKYAAVKALESLAELAGSLGNPALSAARWAAVAAAAGAGAIAAYGQATGYEREAARMQGKLEAQQAVAGTTVGTTTVGGAQAESFGKTVQAQPMNVTIIPSVTITGDLIGIGPGGVAALSDSLKSIIVEEVNDAVTEGEITLDNIAGVS